MRRAPYTIETFKQDLAEKYAWPGGYPKFFVTNDGAALCHDCAKKEQERIIEAIQDDSRCGWRVVGCDVNWEDTELHCEHCSKPVESAYGEISFKWIKS